MRKHSPGSGRGLRLCLSLSPPASRSPQGARGSGRKFSNGLAVEESQCTIGPGCLSVLPFRLLEPYGQREPVFAGTGLTALSALDDLRRGQLLLRAKLLGRAISEALSLRRSVLGKQSCSNFLRCVRYLLRIGCSKNRPAAGGICIVRLLQFHVGHIFGAGSRGSDSGGSSSSLAPSASASPASPRLSCAAYRVYKRRHCFRICCPTRSSLPALELEARARTDCGVGFIPVGCSLLSGQSSRLEATRQEFLEDSLGRLSRTGEDAAGRPGRALRRPGFPKRRTGAPHRSCPTTLSGHLLLSVQSRGHD